MAKFLAARIVGGYLTYAEVPSKLKDVVAAELTAMERTDLLQAD